VAAVDRAVLVDAPVAEVWSRVVTPEGINDELRPWLTMRMPASSRGMTVDTAPLGPVLGRAWLRLFGVVPVDYDRLSIVSREPERSFHEVSTMLSMRHWEHRRTLTPVDSSATRVRDVIVLVPRLRVMAPIVTPLVRALFAHRHRRLRRHFSG
jgi:ligand-binding SRPBCC domain-containing protein